MKPCNVKECPRWNGVVANNCASLHDVENCVLYRRIRDLEKKPDNIACPFKPFYPGNPEYNNCSPDCKLAWADGECAFNMIAKLARE